MHNSFCAGQHQKVVRTQESMDFNSFVSSEVVYYLNSWNFASNAFFKQSIVLGSKAAAILRLFFSISSRLMLSCLDK